jgi:hypothetical protein
MNETPPAIRILPMTSDISYEFPECASIGDVQQKYFLDELPLRVNGSYYYRKMGLKAVSGTVVLFQCQACIIASATLTGMQRFEKQTEDGYDGCLNFDVTSIMTFKPVEANILKDIWPSFKGFNQVRQELDPLNYLEFEKRLERVMRPEMLFSTQGNTYLPTKEDFEVAYRTLTRLGEHIPVDAVLDQIEISLKKEGHMLKNDWRMITESNIEIWK